MTASKTKVKTKAAADTASVSVSSGLRAAVQEKIAGQFVNALLEVGRREVFLKRGIGYAQTAITKRESALESAASTKEAIDTAFEAGDESKLNRIMTKFRKVSVPSLPTKKDEDYEDETAE